MANLQSPYIMFEAFFILDNQHVAATPVNRYQNPLRQESEIMPSPSMRRSSILARPEKAMKDKNLATMAYDSPVH